MNMNYQEFEKIASAKLDALNVDQLKHEALGLKNDMSEAATCVLSVILKKLENKMPEADFVAFCDSL